MAKPDGQKEDPETSAVTTHEARRVPGSRSLLMELSSITRLLSSNGSAGDPLALPHGRRQRRPEPLVASPARTEPPPTRR